MMKKLLSFLLAFAMLFTSVAASAAVPASKIPDFLDKTGIIKAGTFADETAIITRGEFVNQVVKLISGEGYKGLSTEQIFNDVPTDSPYFDATTLLYHLYIVVGDGSKNFEPNEPLTAEAACKILVNLLGDQYFAQYYGGYIPAASNKNLLKGVNFTDNQLVDVKAAMRLIYNTMIADISNSNLYDGNATDDAEFEMFMSKRLGIYKTEGIITDDGNTSLDGDTKIKENQIRVDQDVFENRTDMTELLGYEVEAFYKYDEVNDTNYIIFIYVKGSEKAGDSAEVGPTAETNSFVLDDDDIERYSNLTYEYYVDENQDETEEAYLNPTYRIIYNGRAYSTETQEDSFTKSVEEMLKPENGSVKLIDTDRDGYYDIVNVTDYQIVVVQSVDLDNYVIYGDPKYTPDKSNPSVGVRIELDKAREDLVVRGADGTDYQFDTINKGTVLSVAKAADGKSATIGYSTRKEVGILASTDGEEYYVGEQAYKGTKSFKEYVAANANALKIGNNYAFYFTFDGKIAYIVSEAEASIKIGYLYNVFLKSAMDDTLTIRLMTDSSSVADYVAAKKVVVDGKLYKDLEALNAYLEGFEGNLIRYRVNNDGEFNWIDTPYDAAGVNPNYMTESDDSLHIVKGAKQTRAYYFSKAQAFMSLGVALDSRTKCFLVPLGEPVENIVATDITNSKISGNRPHTVTVYSTKVGSIFAEYIIYDITSRYSSVHDDESPVMGVITKVTETINDEGMTVHKVTICDGDQYFEYVTDNADVIKCNCGLGVCATNPIVASAGDVVMYKLNDNMLYDDSLFVCYDYSEDKVVNIGAKTFTREGKWGEFHNFSPSNIEEGGTTESISGLTVILPFYLNKLENNAAEFVFDYWPVTQYYAGEYFDKTTKSPVKRVMGISSAFTIRVNPKGKTFEPIRHNDIKIYNDGNGEIQKGILVLKAGLPTMMIYYK